MNISNLHKITSIRKRIEIRTVLNNGRRLKTKYGFIFVFDGILINTYDSVAVKSPEVRITITFINFGMK